MTKDDTVLDPATGLHLDVKQVVEQIAKELNNGGIPKTLSVEIIGEENLSVKYGGKYRQASQKWLNRECWVDVENTPPKFRIFYHPEYKNWCLGSNTNGSSAKNFIYCGLTENARWPHLNEKWGISNGKSIVENHSFSITGEVSSDGLLLRTSALEESIKALKQDRATIIGKYYALKISQVHFK